MLARTRTIASANVGLLVLVAAGVALCMFWLWAAYPLYAFVGCAVLLFGGAGLLPSRRDLTYSASLGVCLGAFIGGAAGGARFLGAMGVAP